MKADYDAIIIGGGPAGATAAILLARAGWSVAVIEKHAFPRRKVCGECIAAPNLSLLDVLGVGAPFDALAGPELRQAGLFVNGETLIADLSAFAEPPHAYGRALGREHLDALLLQHAAVCGAHILQPCTVRHVAHGPDGRKLCQLAAGNDDRNTTLSAPVLIAANGSWEPDPLVKVHAHLPHRDSDLFAFKGTYQHASLAPGVLPVLAFPGGYGGMVLGDHDRLTFAFCMRRDALHACRERSPGMPAAMAASTYVEQNISGVCAALAGAEPDAPWLSVGPIRSGFRLPWRGDGVFAIGNAAGEAHPILGEGISMAIQSAWMLCAALIPRRAELITGRGAEAIGHDYATHWRRSFAPRIRFAALFAHAAMRAMPAAALLALLRQWPGLLALGARMGAKVQRAASGGEGGIRTHVTAKP